MKDSNKIIDELGGTAAIAELFGISDAAVSKWRVTGIPKARLMYLEVKYPELMKKCHKES